MRLKVLFLLVLCGVSVQACGDDEASAPPGRSVGDGHDGGRDSGPGPIFPVGGSGGGGDEDGGEDMDSGQIADAGDAGGDAGGPTRCLDFEAVPPGSDPLPDMTFNIATAPPDLAVTRASATWDVNCSQPTLLVKLSSGDCPDGDGHEITFFIPANGVEDGTVVLGRNSIEQDSPGLIRVRYTRPGRIDPNGEWGTCAGSNGGLDLIRQLELVEGRRLEGDFQMELTRCDDGMPSVQMVDGEFNVEIPASLDDICP